MYKLREFRQNPDRLSDLLPWACLVAPGIVLNKDGSFQKTFKYRGPDLASATQAELVYGTARLNNALRRLPGGWVVYADSHRVLSVKYPVSTFPDAVSTLIEEERKEYFTRAIHYENEYYLTLVYLPPPENMDKVSRFFIDRGKNAVKRDGAEVYREYLRNFQTEAEKIYNLFSETLKETSPLDDEETLTYLHSCISTKRHKIRVPEIPMYLDAILVDSPLLGGWEPMLGKEHMKIITVMGFPGSSIPGLLDELNRLDFPYRFTTRFIPLDKIDALSELNSIRRKWFGKRKSVFTLIKETITQSESMLIDSDALNKSVDSDSALQEAADDLVSYGYYTCTITVLHEKKEKTVEMVRTFEKIINGLGFSTIDESYNAVDAWLGSIPGLCRANIRRPILHSLNLTHLIPISAVWAGPPKNKHLKGPALMHTKTESTPFRFDLHAGGLDDVGHTMVIGPTGAGKSVFLTMLAAQFRRYTGNQVYIFDKGASSRALTLGVGGDFYDLASDRGKTLAFQPLADIDKEAEKRWAYEWLVEFIIAENKSISPEMKKHLWDALESLATAPKKERTIYGLQLTLQNSELRQMLEMITHKGPFGELFDAAEDTLNYSRWQTFEMGKLMNLKQAVAPTLSYLFHKLEKRFTGAPTILILDECWLFFDNPMFASKIREWLKVLRKANVAVVFATQSINDILQSSIRADILDSCPTKIFLPNVNALEEEVAKEYRTFGLNDEEIKIIGESVPKKQYYYKSNQGSRLFELAMGEFALAYCGASSPEDHEAIWNILEMHGRENFNLEWLRYKGLESYMGKYTDLFLNLSKKAPPKASEFNPISPDSGAIKLNQNNPTDLVFNLDKLFGEQNP